MKTYYFLFLTIIIILLSSCATIINGRYQTVTINSIPAGAVVKVDNVLQGTTPLKVKVKRSSKHYIDLQSTNNEIRTFVMKRKVENLWYVLDLPLSIYSFGIPWIIDSNTKAAYSMQKKEITIDFEKPIQPVDVQLQVNKCYELLGRHNIDSLRAIEENALINKLKHRKDSSKAIVTRRIAYNDSVNKEIILRRLTFYAKSPNIITIVPYHIIENHFEVMYGRFIKSRIAIGTNVELKLESNFGRSSNRQFNTSPAFGFGPQTLTNKYNAYEKIWRNPYASGYYIGLLTRYYIHKHQCLFVQGELFSQNARFDNVNVMWNRGEAVDYTQDSCKTTVFATGIKLLFGASISTPLSKNIAVYCDTYLGCSIQNNFVNIFHYRYSESKYFTRSNLDQYHEKTNQQENFNYISILPRMGIRVGLRF